jgi:hypothetical protein
MCSCQVCELYNHSVLHTLQSDKVLFHKGGKHVPLAPQILGTDVQEHHDPEVLTCMQDHCKKGDMNKCRGKNQTPHKMLWLLEHLPNKRRPQVQTPVQKKN